jgi:hypothetical protein
MPPTGLDVHRLQRCIIKFINILHLFFLLAGVTWYLNEIIQYLYGLLHLLGMHMIFPIFFFTYLTMGRQIWQIWQKILVGLAFSNSDTALALPPPHPPKKNVGCFFIVTIICLSTLWAGQSFQLGTNTTPSPKRWFSQLNLMYVPIRKLWKPF